MDCWQENRCWCSWQRLQAERDGRSFVILKESRGSLLSISEFTRFLSDLTPSPSLLLSEMNPLPIFLWTFYLWIWVLSIYLSKFPLLRHDGSVKCKISHFPPYLSILPRRNSELMIVYGIGSGNVSRCCTFPVLLLQQSWLFSVTFTKSFEIIEPNEQHIHSYHVPLFLGMLLLQFFPFSLLLLQFLFFSFQVHFQFVNVELLRMKQCLVDQCQIGFLLFFEL